MPALPLASAGTVSPAAFPTVGDLVAEVRRLDAAIDALLDEGRDDEQAAPQAARAGVIARIIVTPARDVRGCRLKAELLAETLETVCADPVAEGLLASLERDLDALDRGV